MPEPVKHSELESRFPKAWKALPAAYKADHSALDFFIDVNGNLCAIHLLCDEEYIFNGKWKRIR
jgi:hypothetical protein